MSKFKEPFKVNFDKWDHFAGQKTACWTAPKVRRDKRCNEVLFLIVPRILNRT